MDINGTIGKIKNAVNGSVAVVEAKTTSTLEKSKLNSQIKTLQYERSVRIGNLGEKAFALWNSGNLTEKLLQSELEAVAAVNQETERLKKEIEAIEKREQHIINANLPGSGNQAYQSIKVVCPECGEVYDHDVNFCRKCGSRISNV